ncbi:hypothetical protein E2C01_008028 [Portunus trituberculatus]|uniref:Uncharacterized protein n=1 Tax=Portunus trituberculatus TaxID=210409 RepID=A0A5B7D534_PORTR|nr:hypothetical protein [Portunus trituberculatus]
MIPRHSPAATKPGRRRAREFLNTGYFLPPSPVTPFPAAGRETNTNAADPSKGQPFAPHGQPLYKLAARTGTHQKLQTSSFHDNPWTNNMIPLNRISRAGEATAPNTAGTAEDTYHLPPFQRCYILKIGDYSATSL